MPPALGGAYTEQWATFILSTFPMNMNDCKIHKVEFELALELELYLVYL